MHASLGNCVVSSWACVLKLLGRSMSWLGDLPVTRPLSEQGGALPGALQSDRVLWIHRGLQFVDILGLNKCICEICSIMLFPCDCIWISFLLNHICLVKGNAGACASVVGSPALVVVRAEGGACGRRQSTSLVLMFLPLSLLPPFHFL